MPDRRHLRSMLADFSTVDALEAAHHAAMIALCAEPGDVFARDHWTPGHFTASSFVVSPDRQDILLIFHEKFRRWLQPGGHCEPGDGDVIATARREVAEETGVTALSLLGAGLFDVDVHEIPPRKGDPAHRHFDVRLCFQAGSRAFAAGSDALAARWVPIVDVPKVETDESVMRAVRKLEALLAG